eukprot:m.146749 g.146749  ORF g.146749 m.146749 type:complete len:503 (+) comp17775_c0_seq1:133-1641(+)
MSLADELLADLEALDSGDETLDVVDEAAEGGLGNADDGDAAMEVDLDDGMHGSISEIAKLSTSEQLTRIISSIDKFTEDRESQPQVMGPIEENPEYKLIVEGNNLTQEIDSELGVIHKFVRDNYAKRFPELEQLVLHPLDYIRTVKVMQNQMDCTHLDLSETIAPATIMVVSVTASTTQGKQLSEEELKRVLEACDMGLALNDAKNKIFDYVESRMFFLAPNVTHICGANTAAKMLGVAGGLTNLSKMPACNIQLLGSAKRSLAGFSAAAMLPHTGFVYYCEIVQKQPPEYRKKAARLVAAKVALAARVDSYHEERSKGATLAISLRADILKKLSKAQEPPPAKIPKALPRPDMDAKKKRGGKRVRKMKERFSTSEIRKAANRMGFADIEEDVLQDEMGFSLGQLGKASGHFRMPDTQRKKGGTISKKMRQRLAQQQAASRGGAMSSIRGLTSASAGTASVAFTPVQGLEIIRGAQAATKSNSANDKYFADTKGFASVTKKV